MRRIGLLAVVGLLVLAGAARAFNFVPQSAFSYYYGFTSQHLKLSATLVYGKKLWDFDYRVAVNCADGRHLSPESFDWPSTGAPGRKPRPIKHGAFKFTDTSYASTATTVTGKVHGKHSKHISGSFTLTTDINNSTCKSGLVSYKLTRAPFKPHWWTTP